MKRCESERRNTRGALCRAAAMALALCLLVTSSALGASSVGDNPNAIPSVQNKTYIKLSKPVYFFTGTAYKTGTSVEVPKGSVWQLFSEDYYTYEGVEYYSVFYNNTRYNVRRSDARKDILSAEKLIEYFKNTVWKQTSFTTLRKDERTGDVQTHALQYALYTLGYYKGALDGDYGKDTYDAVAKFQRANKLDPDGRAGPITQAAIYSLVLGNSSPGGGTQPTGGNTGTTGTGGSLKTTASVNLRKSASTKSPRLAIVPIRTTLAYIDTYKSGGITWYNVVYNGHSGWLMGTFVNAGGYPSGSGGGATAPAIGKVTITKKGTVVRVTANGKRTGTLLAKGLVVDLISSPTTVGGYTWHNIRTASGLVGFVRGDCSTATMGGSSTVTPTTEKTFVKLPADTVLFTSEEKSKQGETKVSAGTVLQMVSTSTYKKGGVEYCSLYFNNQRYNAVYSEVKSGKLSDKKLAEYVLSLWNQKLTSPLKQEFELVGDVRVYAMQVALYVLGFYTGNIDGNFGGGSASAVRNFQRKNKLEVDSSCGENTWAELAKQAKKVSDGSTTGGGSGEGGGGGTNAGDFGVVNSVEKAKWDDDGVELMKKGTTATVMDVATGKVFTVYRWSGGDHADCVPLTANDTKTMCDIVGFPYNPKHPNSAQLEKIMKNSGTMGWPDFGNDNGSGHKIGDKWDRRPAWLNVNGRVFCVSVYGWPHGFNGKDAFANSKFPNGTLFYKQNNYYGMICIHFVGSTTHSSSTPDSKHQAAIQKAYDEAKKKWPTLVK